MALSVLPGLSLCGALAALAIGIGHVLDVAVLNPVVVALAAGLAARGVFAQRVLLPGIAFAVRPLLRAAIVLLGLQVTAGEMLELGGGAIAAAVLAVALTPPAAVWLGSRLGVPYRMSALLGAGTGICGASAIVAANEAVRGRAEDVAYALAVITLCGTAALVALPLFAVAFGLSPVQHGVWAGASLHEVVQAVGAAGAGGAEATQAGTVTKLMRVMLLAPVVLALGWWTSRRGGGGRGSGAPAPVPWFALGFLGMSALASTGHAPAAATEASRAIVPFLLATSVAALGLSTDLAALRARGPAPLVLGALLTCFVAAVTLLVVATLVSP